MPALHAKIKRGLVEYPVWLRAGMSLPSFDLSLAVKWSQSYGMKGFDFGTVDEIERKLINILKSEVATLTFASAR